LSPTNPVNDNILLYEARLIITIEDKDKRPKIFRIENNLTTQHKPNSKNIYHLWLWFFQMKSMK